MKNQEVALGNVHRIRNMFSELIWKGQELELKESNIKAHILTLPPSKLGLRRDSFSSSSVWFSTGALKSCSCCELIKTPAYPTVFQASIGDNNSFGQVMQIH